MNQHPRDEKGVFFAALKQATPSERDAYVQHVCGEDNELLGRVQKLLDAHDESVGPLDMPPPGINHAPTVVQPSIAEKSGTQIGSYKLLEQIGEGGMGMVYMAEQSEPVARRVALKIIKPGMDSRQVIARFEAERQALAVMDHPNIAKVIDAGTTESGRPYFVMELVKGVPITQYCDQHKLSVRERLELFVPVCQAIQHAHQKGIIHRDIKPSNVLVARYDDRPVPKIIDFGVAKATQQKLTEKTAFTQFGQIVGTFEYMSPEQAQFNQLDIDTRSDVYSLGVLLYELLTGQTPFDGQRLRTAAFDELLRILREEDPPRPSLRLTTSGSLPEAAANRHVEPKRLSSLVRGELDWIVMKALEKDRTRRYETATALAADIEHYLNDEPVTACPPSSIYLIGKFTRRNKGWLSTAAVVLLTTLVGLTVSTVLIARERDRALIAEDNAETDAAIARAVNEYLQNDLLGMAKPESQVLAEVPPDPNIELRTIVDRAAETIGERFVDEPLVKAAIEATIGTTYQSLGLYEKAEEHHRRAFELRKQHLGPEHPATLVSATALGDALHRQARYPEAETIHRDILDVRQQILGVENPRTLRSKSKMASARFRQGNAVEAARVHREVLEIRQRILGPEHPDTLASRHKLAAALRQMGHDSEAETLDRETLLIQRQVLGPEHPATLATLHNLALSRYRQGDHAGGETRFRELLEIERRVLGAEHPCTLTTMHNLAAAMMAQGRFEESAELCRTVVDLRKRILGPEHSATLATVHNLAICYSEMAWKLATTEDPAERDPAQAAEFSRKAVALNPSIAKHWNNLGVALYRKGDWGEATDAFQKADGMLKEGDRDHRFFAAMAHWQLGEREEAYRCFAQATNWLNDAKRNADQYRWRDEAEELLEIDPSRRDAIVAKYSDLSHVQ